MNGKMVINLYEDALKSGAKKQEIVQYPGYEKALEFAKKNAPVIWCDVCGEEKKTTLAAEAFVCSGCGRRLSSPLEEDEII